ncbi:hypothetical protein ACFVRD_43415 [Streptomyces sp. NPDC057908]|uniref:hypothetical protein n=1 Tax=Streptomyces sp. NPDC057908 TaxID=3346276 RepID=UPI0036E19E23
MTDFEDFEWVVWRLEVQDPRRLAGEDPDLDERTQEPMTELAASLGCVYEHCVDYDSYDDETPYYAWWVRLPVAEHARLGATSYFDVTVGSHSTVFSFRWLEDRCDDITWEGRVTLSENAQRIEVRCP